VDWESPLYIALAKGNSEIGKLLVRHGAPLGKDKNSLDSTYLARLNDWRSSECRETQSNRNTRNSGSQLPGEVHQVDLQTIEFNRRQTQLIESLEERLTQVEQTNANQQKLIEDLQLQQNDSEQEIQRLQQQIQTLTSGQLERDQQSNLLKDKVLQLEGDLENINLRIRPMEVNHLREQFKLSQPSLNDFEISDLLGSGSFGMVWKAGVKGFPRNIPSLAMKMTRNYGTDTSRITTDKDFINEFDILQHLTQIGSHRNIIQMVHQFACRPTDVLLQHTDESVRDTHYHQGSAQPRTTTFYALELHPETVLDCLNREGQLEHSRLNQFAKDLFKGLVFLKNSQVVHMDMKLDNLLISQDDRLVIADFGCAIVLNPESCAAVGHLLGNLLHISPELHAIARQNPTMNERNKVLIDFSPQYSWEAGTILYELCCGQFPFDNYPSSTCVVSRRTLNLQPIPERFHDVLVGLLICSPRMSLEDASALIHQL